MYLHDEKISQFKNILKLVFKSFVQTGSIQYRLLPSLQNLFIKMLQDRQIGLQLYNPVCLML